MLTMPARFLNIMTGRNPPRTWQPRRPQPSTINEKTLADFVRVVERSGILGKNKEVVS
jgi:hypothetical protein